MIGRAARNPDIFAHDGVSICIILSFFIGLATSFGIGLLTLVVISFILAIRNYNQPRMLTYILIMVAVDPVMRTYLMGGVLFRYHSFDYLLLSLVLINFLYGGRVHLKPIRIYMFLLLWMIIGLLISKDIVLGGLSIVGYLGFLAFYLILWHAVDSPGFGDILHDGLRYGILASLLFSMLFFLSFGIEVFRQDLFDEFGGDYINPNSFSYMPLAGIVFSTLLVKLFGHSARKQLIIQLILFGIIGLSGSRGSFIVGGLAIFFSLSGAIRTTRLVFVRIIAYFILSFSATLLKTSGVYTLERLSTFFQEEKDLSTASSGRSEIAFIGFQMFKSRPLVGLGTGSFRETFAELTASYQYFGSDFLRKKQGDRIAAHSAYVKVMAENGLIGLILLTGFLLSIYKARTKDNFHIIAFSILVISLLSTEFNAKVPWFICAFTIVMYRKNTTFKHT
ncbi:MAG: O-antigen ligase family protein [Saprospiraceae bacterium]|nr:O-antigen ligase family protein [Saprospiraceae bacterium]